MAADIDFVLVYREPEETRWGPFTRAARWVADVLRVPHRIPDTRAEILRQRRQAREIYQKRLIEAGLILRVVSACESNRRNFVLCHAPDSVLERHADVIGIKKKLSKSFLFNYTALAIRFLTFRSEGMPETCIGEDLEYSMADRVLIVKDLLSRINYGANNQPHTVGIDNMVDQNIYTLAYPIHDDPAQHQLSTLSSQSAPKPAVCEREWLSIHWATFYALFMEQPLDVVRSYFGPQVALYFAFFGSYTTWLAFIALPSFLFKLITSVLDISGSMGKLNILSEPVLPKGVCEAYRGRGVMMCPQCHTNCDFESLDGLCTHQLPFLYTPHALAPVFHSFVVCVAASCFVQYWKRREACLVHRWSLKDNVHDEEMLRPEFLRAQNRTLKLNKVTSRMEPAHSKFHRVSVALLELIIILLMLVTILGVNFGCHLLKYHIRSVLVELLKLPLDRITIVCSSLFSAAVHSTIILLLNWICEIACLWIVNWENPRTQREFDDHYSKMIFIFQFLDYFSPLFYIIFGRTTVSLFYARFDPDQITNAEEGPWRRWVVDACTYTCLEELDQAMIIFFCFTQIFRELLKFGRPFLIGICRRLFLRKGTRSLPQWETDFFLPTLYNQQLCFDYLRLIIQFAYVVLFSSSFPMAPLLALVVNGISLRADAIKFLRSNRRAVPKMVPSIGVWLKVLSTVSTFSVIVNGFVLAFTTDIVPRWFYLSHHPEQVQLNGLDEKYFDFTYAHFDSRNLSIPLTAHQGTNSCRFYGMYERPCTLFPEDNECHDTPQKTREFLQVLIYRVLFLSLFMNMVFLINWIVRAVYPADPPSVRLARKSDHFRAQQAMDRISRMSDGKRESRKTRSKSRDKKLPTDFSGISIQPNAIIWRPPPPPPTSVDDAPPTTPDSAASAQPSCPAASTPTNVTDPLPKTPMIGSPASSQPAATTPPVPVAHPKNVTEQ
ncbi:unnamed protein product, partial [Mesorhabditis spiculigera]